MSAESTTYREVQPYAYLGERREGTRLQELRRSNAAGKHDSRPRRERDRSTERRVSIQRNIQGW